MFIISWKRVPPNKSCSQAYRALHQRIGVNSVYELINEWVMEALFKDKKTLWQVS